jgi:AcrR family transcriptional regulator
MSDSSESKRPRASLDRHAVLREALLLVDEHGLNALNMRALARRLGVEAMTLYYHVRNRAAILDGLIELVLGDVETPPLDRPWPDRLRELARSYRSVLLRHPNVMPLLATSFPATPSGWASAAAVGQMLLDGGLGLPAASRWYRILSGYVNGFLLAELRSAPQQAALRDDQSDIASLPKSTRRQMTAMTSALARGDPERDFMLGLDALLRGLEMDRKRRQRAKVAG